MNFTEEQVLQISKGDREIAAFINSLLDHIQQLNSRIQELERQVGQNSQNSSKPPSSDGFRKPPKSSRQTGGKKGAPHGHKGHTLQMVDNPDELIVLPLHTCEFCNHSLEDVICLGYERRQVLDLPPIRLRSTEYRTESKCCPHCLALSKAKFPLHVTAPIQYGERFHAWVVYLNQFQLLPLQRIRQFFVDFVGQDPSEATLLQSVRKCAKGLASATQTIRERLLHNDLLHADETGFRVNGKQHWVHTVCDDRWTLLSVHESRGLKAVNDNGLLPDYKGRVMHDSLAMYFNDQFQFDHALCGAHLIRECQGIIENDGHLWATDMKHFLQDAWGYARAARQNNQPPDAQLLAQLEKRYDEILLEGQKEWGPPKRSKLRKGRIKKTKAANLGGRFIEYKPYILGFLRDARIPFDNNQAERDLRMVKVKQKISGTMRTDEGADAFMCIRSVIASLRKQSQDIFESLVASLRGELTL